MDPEASAALDEIIRAAVEAGDVQGAVAVVADRDGILYRRAFGVMDEAGVESMRTDAIFQITSMTKPITSVGIMMLQEDGLLSLDDDASDYLPELSGRQVLVGVNRADSSVLTRPAARPITILDLLRHTSGFGYSFASRELFELERHTRVRARAQPILHDPGERWTYGMGTAFLGWIIEEISGETLANFLEARVMGPLRMTNTSFDLVEEDRTRLVATHRRVGRALEGRPRPKAFRSTGRGDGGLFSTADDYARFIQMILGRGARAGVRLISEESIAEMVRDQLDGCLVVEQVGGVPSTSRAFPLGAGRDGFGLGFQVTVGKSAGGRPPGSLSWAGVQNTHFWIDLENEIGVVLLLQLLPFYDEKVVELLTSFERAVYGGLLRSQP